MTGTRCWHSPSRASIGLIQRAPDHFCGSRTILSLLHSCTYCTTITLNLFLFCYTGFLTLRDSGFQILRKAVEDCCTSRLILKFIPTIHKWISSIVILQTSRWTWCILDLVLSSVPGFVLEEAHLLMNNCLVVADSLFNPGEFTFKDVEKLSCSFPLYFDISYAFSLAQLVQGC